MRHKFYLPIGMPTFNVEPTLPGVGDTYFDTRSTFLMVRTWDGTKWTGGADEVAISDTKPNDTNVELWVNTSVTSTSSSGWSLFDDRYATKRTQVAADVDLVPTSGYWIVDDTTGGTLPPGDGPQVLHAIVLSPDVQVQYSYEPHSDGMAKVHTRNQSGGVWSAWQNVTPTVVG